MDRFDEKAREIITVQPAPDPAHGSVGRVMVGGVPLTTWFYSQESMDGLLNAERALTAAILRAAAADREEIRAAAQPVASKPVAGEWEACEPGVRRRYLPSGHMAAYASPCDWSVTVRSGADHNFHPAANLDAAMLAADAWARDNAHLLDWTLPPAPDVLAAQATTLAPPAKQTRFEFIPATYALYYPAMCETARELGYALALHGSMARDLDVVAVPWTKEAVSAEELVARLVERHKFTIGDKLDERRPHGRRGWVLWFGGHFYVDLAVMPRTETP